MAYKTGTASNHADFIEQLVKFLTSDEALVANKQNWQLLHDFTVPATKTAIAARKIAFKAPGLAGEDEIFIAIGGYGDTALDYYNLSFLGGTSFNANAITGGSIGSGLANASPAVQIMLWDNPMQYWLIANGRRVVVGVKVSTVYQSAYAGFILPPCPPSQYPYPLAIVGSYAYSAVRWSIQTEEHRGITTPYTKSCWLRDISGRWLDFGSYNGYGGTTGYADRILHPLGVNQVSTSAYSKLIQVRDTAGSYPLLPITFCTKGEQGKKQFGELDGVVWLPALNNGAEDIIAVNAVNYIVMQTAWRSGNPWLFGIKAD